MVTGGLGFIGSNLCEALVRAGHEVHSVDILPEGESGRRIDGVVYHNGLNILHTLILADVFTGADCVFHEAALPRVQFSIEYPLETSENNIQGTVSVLVAAKKAGVRRVVYAASSSAYGDQDVLPLVETMSAQPKSPYGLQKYIGELLCRTWSDVYGLETVSLRYFNVYGPRLDPDGAYALVVGKFLKQRAEGEVLTITGDGEQTRDFTHVSDVVRANILAMESAKVGKGEVINIGAGNNISINTIADLVGGERTYVPARLEPKDTCADNRRAKELLSWEPQMTLEEGVGQLKKEWNLA